MKIFSKTVLIFGFVVIGCALIYLGSKRYHSDYVLIDKTSSQFPKKISEKNSLKNSSGSSISPALTVSSRISINRQNKEIELNKKNALVGKNTIQSKDDEISDSFLKSQKYDEMLPH